MKTPRIYIDTSVVGGCFDQEFARESKTLFQFINRGQMIGLVSDLLVEELELAPSQIQEFFGRLDPKFLESIERSTETEILRDAYLKAGVVSQTHINDAHHVALATIGRADLIVSWNFKHIVHYDKIRGFNAINLTLGYPVIDIRSPKEVV